MTFYDSAISFAPSIKLYVHTKEHYKHAQEVSRENNG